MSDDSDLSTIVTAPTGGEPSGSSLVVVSPGSSGGGLTGSSIAASIISYADTTTAIDPTVSIIGSPIEGTTLTASVITSGFTGTTDIQWQRFYDGSWWNIPVELSPYSSGEVLSFVTTPTYVVREEDEEVSGIRVEVTLVDNTGVTDAVVDSASIGPILAATATLSLSSITGSPVVGSTLTVSGLVTSEDFTGPPTLYWQRYYSGGWWDIPIELSPYSSGEALTYVTTPTYVVRAEDEDVLAIRVEAVYVDNTGQTYTAFSDLGTNGAALTIVEPPMLMAANVALGEDDPSVALAITDMAFDTEYTLGSVTLSGVPSGWSLSGDDAASIAAGTWTADAGGLAGLVLVAPSPDAPGTFTLGVTASESAAGPSGILTATGTTSFAVTVSAVAEPPLLTAAHVFLPDFAHSVTLRISDTASSSDDTLGNLTISGVPSGWSLSGDGAASVVAGTWTADPGDLSDLVLVAPFHDHPQNFTLSVTGTESDAASTATATTSFAVIVFHPHHHPDSDASTVVAMADSAESVSFATGTADTLTLDQSAGFAGPVSGFGAGDAIDLADLAFANNMSLSYADNGSGGGTLTVNNGTQVVDLALLGQYAAAGFQAHSDPGGGTLITYSPQTSSTEAASLANPNH